MDIGGITSVENEAICVSATHMVILAGDTAKFAQWREFAEKVGLTVVAEIHSDYPGTEDTIEGVAQDGVLRGSVHHLERGESIASRPMIKRLAEHLLAI